MYLPKYHITKKFVVNVEKLSRHMYLAFDTIDISAHYRHVAKSKNLRGQVERRRAAAAGGAF